MFMDDVPDGDVTPIKVPVPLGAVVVIGVLATIVVGVFPGLVSDLARRRDTSPLARPLTLGDAAPRAAARGAHRGERAHRPSMSSRPTPSTRPGYGFYVAGGGAGRRRDFLTSPEIGPLFGAVRRPGPRRLVGPSSASPSALTVVDAGAGPGGLARTILAAGPRCAGALVRPGRRGGGAVGHPPRRHHQPRRHAGARRAGRRAGRRPRQRAARQPPGGAGPSGPPTAGRRSRSGSTACGSPRSCGRSTAEQVAWCEARVGEVALRRPDPGAGRCRRLAARVRSTWSARPAGSWSSTTPGPPPRWPPCRCRAWLRTYAQHEPGGLPARGPGSLGHHLRRRRRPARAGGRARRRRAPRPSSSPPTASRSWWPRAGRCGRELGLAGGLEAIAAQSRIVEAEALIDPDRSRRVHRARVDP